MCPDWESNWNLFGAWNDVPMNWTTQSGLSSLIFKKKYFSHYQVGYILYYWKIEWNSPNYKIDEMNMFAWKLPILGKKLSVAFLLNMNTDFWISPKQGICNLCSLWVLVLSWEVWVLWHPTVFSWAPEFSSWQLLTGNAMMLSNSCWELPSAV